MAAVIVVFVAPLPISGLGRCLEDGSVFSI